MRLGYNTNGLAHHRWADALRLIAETGYESAAITVDHHFLDPFSPRLNDEVREARRLLDDLQLACVIETGARFLLNPRIKHDPTLMTAEATGRRTRIDFLRRCIDIAVELNAEAVSFWSGILREDIDRKTGLHRLAEGVDQVVQHADSCGMRLAFEPEPGMFLETMQQFAELDALIDSPGFGLTLDIGHLHCVEDVDAEPISAHLERWKDRLFNVHIEDMLRGVHEHLRFGEGEIDFPPVMAALEGIAYTGGVHVELSRHSHAAPEVMRESLAFLSEAMTALD